MELFTLQSAMLIVGLLLLMGQLLVRQKQLVHLVFAIFCGSIAMLAAKQLGNEQLGAYQYLIGMGACATCNGFWLVSRALFREQNAIGFQHIVAAVGVALMLIAGQALGLAQSVGQGDASILQISQTALYAVVNLFSSCMLVLTAWEGCRGLTATQGEQRWQRILFLGSYCTAVFICTVVVKLADTPQAGTELNLVLSAVCAIQIMVVTQVLIYWRFHTQSKFKDVLLDEQQRPIIIQSTNCHSPIPDYPISDSINVKNHPDLALAKKIQQMLNQQDMYLQANLKVADLARAMDVSEYRISRIFREHFKARNFNQFINQMRIEHAKTLLADPQNTHWPIVVVGMESGFASVGPFTRAFKEISGITPNQYRQSVQRGSS